MGDARIIGRRFWLTVVACTVAVSAESTAAPAEAVVLSPHRAVYDITLDRAAGGSGIAEMSGRMVYELTGNVCTGYSQSMRFVTQVVNQEVAYHELGRRRLAGVSLQYHSVPGPEVDGNDGRRRLAH